MMDVDKLKNLYTKLLYQDMLDLDDDDARYILQDLVGDEINRLRKDKSMDIKEATKLINELRNSTEYMEIYGGASNEPMNVALEIAVDSMQKLEAMKPMETTTQKGRIE